jgi:hypothetical protein
MVALVPDGRAIGNVAVFAELSGESITLATEGVVAEVQSWQGDDVPARVVQLCEDIKQGTFAGETPSLPDNGTRLRVLGLCEAAEERFVEGAYRFAEWRLCEAAAEFRQGPVVKRSCSASVTHTLGKYVNDID